MGMANMHFVYTILTSRFFGRIRVAHLFSFLYFDLFVFVLCLVFNVASAS